MNKPLQSVDNASFRISYDWASLNIDLDFDKKDLDIDSILADVKKFGNSNHERLFIHEYVHFLQNFYTSAGAFTFCELVLFFEKMGASSLNEKFEVKLPLKIEEKENLELWNGGVEHYKKFIRLLDTDYGNITYEKKCEYPNVIICESTIHKTVLNNGRMSYTINAKTIREHMAELSSLLFLDYSDKQIHEYFISKNSFCSSKGILDMEPMYWMLFEFFYQNNFRNVSEGLVLLCHSALCSATPIHTIARFFKQSNDQGLHLKASNNLFVIVNGFLFDPLEIVAFSFSFHASLLSLHKQLELCTKHSDHDFYRFNSVIFAKLMANISTYFSGTLIFRNPFLFRQKETWSTLLKQTGTPIIRYKDKTPVVASYDTSLSESLKYFLGVVKVLKNLQDSSSTACPFLSEFNICKAHYKDKNKCYNEPIIVVNPDKDGTECHYRNSIILLGLKERLNL